MEVQVTPQTFLTLTGVSREMRCAIATLRRKIESGEVLPDGVLVETQGRPGSLLFKSDKLPSIAAALATKPK